MAVITLAVHATATVKYLSSLISTCNCASIKHLLSATLLLLQQLPRLDSAHQPGHPSVGRRAAGMCNEQQPNGGDALQLGVKGSYHLCVGGR